MGDVAERSIYDEEWFYKTFGIDGEILVDHAWGIEPVAMADIKNYHTSSHSLSNGQVLPRPYKYGEARNVFAEMIDVLCCDMLAKKIVAKGFSWWVSYDWKSMEACPDYNGPVAIDFYGRLHPNHTGGTARLQEKSNSFDMISSALLAQFDKKTDHRLLYRRLGVNAMDITEDNGKAARKNRPLVTVTFYAPCSDEENDAFGRKGTYREITGIVSRVEPVLDRTMTIGRQILKLENIAEIREDLLDDPGSGES